MSKNLEHSHRVVQIPSGGVHVDVTAQACLHPLMNIPQIVSWDKQTMPLVEDGRVLMEAAEDEQWDNKGPLESHRQRMLQVGEDIQEDKELENEHWSSERRSSI